MTEAQKQHLHNLAAQLHQLGMQHKDPQLFYIAEELKKLAK